MLSVSIVIPAYNEEEYIGRLLKSLQNLSPEDILEIIVVDNGSSDKTKEIVRQAMQKQTNVRLVEESRKGVAFARDRGAQEAKGEILAFLDADIYITDDWFKTLAEIFSRDDVVCLSGPTYFYDISRMRKFLVYIYWWFSSVIIYRMTGFMGIFGNMIIRANALKKIGGIDLSIEFYGDDTNITRRLSKYGKVIFTRSFFVYTSGRRLRKEGIVATGWRYVMNFFSETLLHKSITKGYTEIR